MIILCTALIAALGKIRQNTPALSYGSYTELQLTNRQFAFARDLDSVRVIVTVNNDDNDAWMNLPAGNAVEYIGTLTAESFCRRWTHQCTRGCKQWRNLDTIRRNICS